MQSVLDFILPGRIGGHIGKGTPSLNGGIILLYRIKKVYGNRGKVDDNSDVAFDHARKDHFGHLQKEYNEVRLGSVIKSE